MERRPHRRGSGPPFRRGDGRAPPPLCPSPPPRAGSSWLGPDVIQTWQQFHFKGLSQTSRQRGHAAAGATRTPGPRGSPGAAGGACPPFHPSAVRAARCRAERACIQSFTAPPNSSKTGRQPLKTLSRARQVPPHQHPPPRGRAPAGRGRALSPGAPGSRAARSTCEPFVFPAAGRCLRAAPGARRPPRHPRRTALPSPELKLVGAGTRQQQERELLVLAPSYGSGRTPSPPAAPSPRRQRRAPGRGQHGEGPTPRRVRPTARVPPAHGRTFCPSPACTDADPPPAITNDNWKQ